MKSTVQTSNRFLFLAGNEDFTIPKTAAAKIARARGQRFLFTSARNIVLVNIAQAAWFVLIARHNGTGITGSVSRIQTSNLSSQFTHWLR